MIEILGDHAHPAECVAALDEVVIADGGAELLQGDGKVGVLHLPGQGSFQLLSQAARRIDVPFVARTEEGRKERKSLDVIPVRVRGEEMSALRRPAGGQRLPQPVGTGAAIQNDEHPIRRAHFAARRVAAAADRGRPRLGQCSPGPPESDQHPAPWTAFGVDTVAHRSGEGKATPGQGAVRAPVRACPWWRRRRAEAELFTSARIASWPPLIYSALASGLRPSARTAALSPFGGEGSK